MTQGQAILGVSWGTLIVGIVLVSLRIHSRASKKALSGDDYTIAVASLVCIFGSIANSYQVYYGGGRHVEQVSPKQLSQWLKWTIIAVFQTTVATCLVKISICLFILRMLNQTHIYLRRLIYVVLACLAVFTLAFLLAWGLQCRPLKAAYNFEIEGKCYSKHELWSINYGLGAYNVLTDFFCASLPAFIIFKLQMSTRTKYALSALMGLGVFTAACSIVRLATLSTIEGENAIREYIILASCHICSVPRLDDSAITEIFTILEENLGVIVATIPTLKGVFQRVAHAVSSRSKSLRSLLRRPATNTKEWQNDDVEISATNQTRRDYYELQEASAARQQHHVPDVFKDQGMGQDHDSSRAPESSSKNTVTSLPPTSRAICTPSSHSLSCIRPHHCPALPCPALVSPPLYFPSPLLPSPSPSNNNNNNNNNNKNNQLTPALPHPQRTKAYTLSPYPCIGQFSFLSTRTPSHASYAALLARLRRGASLLDIGTCLGQSLRFLAADGAPSENMLACDLVPGLWEVGYELFRDEGRLRARFVEADALDGEGGIDVILLNHVLHLIDRETQVRAGRNVALLSRPGTWVVGSQVGSLQAGEKAGAQAGTSSTSTAAAATRFFHNLESWRELWGRIGVETGTEWTVEGCLVDLVQGWGVEAEDVEWMGADARGLEFRQESTVPNP
ncbi:tRNA dimethylallyltransferase [Physcia stellaris]|nr:tRNA dimethylallyltransferase [Physcia stellaris]